ncbi:hypothetical protein [Xanthomonas sp. BRIP62415]|uniref:hypothetical protein n=1 Tax=Xanthomonas sp. BRIP62415 TaxID=2182390 RepID=UPI000F8DACA4|nr:hypothetical protein [Xanthomonas sp. BRIP62415]
MAWSVGRNASTASGTFVPLTPDSPKNPSSNQLDAPSVLFGTTDARLTGLLRLRLPQTLQR